MPLDQTSFHPLGPVKSVDLLQFYNLHRGHARPARDVPERAVGRRQPGPRRPRRSRSTARSGRERTNLIGPYVDRSQAQPGSV